MPLAPSNLKMLTSTKGSVTVGWTPGNGATAYRLYKDGTFVSNTGALAVKAKFGALSRKSYVFGVESVTPSGNFKSTITVEPSGDTGWAVTGTNVPLDPVPVTPTWTSSINDGETIQIGTVWSATVTPTPDSVEFWASQGTTHTLLATDSSSPYNVTLNLAPGQYVLGVCFWKNGIRTCFDDRKNVTVASLPYTPSNPAESHPTEVVTL